MTIQTRERRPRDKGAELFRSNQHPKATTVAGLLAETHPHQCHAGRSVERFRRMAEAREGLFWTWALDAAPGELDPESARYVSTVWRLWLEGDRPFRRGGRGVRNP